MMKRGFILVITLMIVSISVILVTFMSVRGRTYLPYARLAIDRQKAHELALGGVQLAISQLSVQPEKKSAEAVKKEQAQKQQQESLTDSQSKALLQEILPVLNQWQKFELKKGRDGIDGVLQICVSCENGKIDINQIYDFKTQKFINENQPQGDYKKMMQELFARIEKISGTKDLFKGFEKFLKERQYRLNDATELLTIKEFESFKGKLFYQPPQTKEREAEKRETSPLFLTDIFTTWSASAYIEPWLFSASLIHILGLNNPPSDAKEGKERMGALLKNFKRTIAWPTEWKTILQPWYGKEFSTLPKELTPILSPSFQANAFCVVSSATVGTVTQKLYAIIQRSEPEDRDAAIECTIKKIYWL